MRACVLTAGGREWAGMNMSIDGRGGRRRWVAVDAGGLLSAWAVVVLTWLSGGSGY